MTGRIPEEVIQAVLRQHDIVETVGKYVHLTKNGKNMKGLCPFHSEKTPSFTVTPEKQIFHCFGCGKGGNSIGFMMEIEGYAFPEAIRVMAEESGIPVTWMPHSTSEPTAGQKDRETLLIAHEYTAKFYHYLLLNTEFGKPAKEYLRGRGLSDKLIDEFQIGYAPDRWDTLYNFLIKREYEPALMEKGSLLSAKSDGSGHVDRFRDRVMFPIWDRDGKTIAFAGRVMGDGQPKYLNSSDSMVFNKGRSLYNFHRARPNIRKTRRIVLFEGYMDVIKAWSAGIKNGVATMGTALTDDHVEIFRRNADEIIICYDGDDAGQAAALKAITLIEKAGMRATVAILPNKMDPDEYITEYGPQAFVRETMDHPVSATKFRLLLSRKNHKLLEEEGRKNYVLEAVEVVSSLDSPTEREFYLKELAREFEISLEALKQESHQMRGQMQKLRPQGDNNDNSWNTGMNEKRRASSSPQVLPAYHQVERRLLFWMMQETEAAETVHDKLGGAFNMEDHAALAAYLYAYYSQGNDPDGSRFIASLQDDRLERTAASILSMDAVPPFNIEVAEAHIREVLKMPKLRELDLRREEQNRAERSGEHLLAAQIASEIETLVRQLKGTS
jgi:DNA primase